MINNVVFLLVMLVFVNDLILTAKKGEELRMVLQSLSEERFESLV